MAIKDSSETVAKPKENWGTISNPLAEPLRKPETGIVSKFKRAIQLVREQVRREKENIQLLKEIGADEATIRTAEEQSQKLSDTKTKAILKLAEEEKSLVKQTSLKSALGEDTRDQAEIAMAGSSTQYDDEPSLEDQRAQPEKIVEPTPPPEPEPKPTPEPEPIIEKKKLELNNDQQKQQAEVDTKFNLLRELAAYFDESLELTRMDINPLVAFLTRESFFAPQRPEALKWLDKKIEAYRARKQIDQLVDNLTQYKKDLDRKKETHYAVLGVEPTATAKDIKSAYRKRQRLFHPDVVKLAQDQNILDPNMMKMVNDIIRRVNSAYAALSEEAELGKKSKRQLYDEQLAREAQYQPQPEHAVKKTPEEIKAAQKVLLAALERMTRNDKLLPDQLQVIWTFIQQFRNHDFTKNSLILPDLNPEYLGDPEKMKVVMELSDTVRLLGDGAFTSTVLLNGGKQGLKINATGYEFKFGEAPPAGKKEEPKKESRTPPKGETPKDGKAQDTPPKDAPPKEEPKKNEQQDAIEKRLREMVLELEMTNGIPNIKRLLEQAKREGMVFTGKNSFGDIIRTPEQLLKQIAAAEMALYIFPFDRRELDQKLASISAMFKLREKFQAEADLVIDHRLKLSDPNTTWATISLVLRSLQARNFFWLVKDGSGDLLRVYPSDVNEKFYQVFVATMASGATMRKVDLVMEGLPKIDDLDLHMYYLAEQKLRPQQLFTGWSKLTKSFIERYKVYRDAASKKK